MDQILTKLQQAKEPLIRARSHIQIGILLNSGINEQYQWDEGQGLLDFEAKGAGSQELSQNMSGLSNLLNDNPELLEKPYQLTPEIKAYLNEIASSRGISVQQAETDYIKFLDLLNEYDINIETARSYGSETQLRFGFIVGDALGIDPVFASLMSPNGGFTGPGGYALNIDGDGLFEELLSGQTGVSNEALSFHAPTHDAFGFLNKNFDIGPGYCYVPNGGDCILGDDSPLSGQISGIQFWDDKLGLTPIDTIKDAGQEISREIVEGGREIWSEVKEAGREVKLEFDEAGREVSDEFREAGREIWNEVSQGDIAGTTSEIIEGTGEVIWQVGEGATETALQTGEGIAETVWQTGEGTLETTRELAEGAVELGNDVKDTIVGDGIPFVPGI